MNTHFPEPDPAQVENAAADTRPILIVPFTWVGDFVRGHSVVGLLNARWPRRPVDMLTTSLTAPLIDYMPGVRKGISVELPHRRLSVMETWKLAKRLRAEGYGTAIVLSRKWKAALPPFLAGVPERIGFIGEARFILLNSARWGERKLPRMVDQCAALALPENAEIAGDWPAPELRVPRSEVASWRARRGLDETRPIVVLAPGAAARSRRWMVSSYRDLARELAKRGYGVWIAGGLNERELAAEIATGSGAHVRDLTGTDLRDAVLAVAAANLVIANDSGLLHVSGAVGTPTIGIFGPSSAWHWAPLNGLAATIEARTQIACRPCHKPICRFGHQQCMRDIPTSQVLAAAMQTLAGLGAAPAH
jgi:heptosyltransferase-2